MEYLLIYFVLLLLGLVSRGESFSRRLLYYICLFGLFFFVGFRYQVGCDWNAYRIIFDSAQLGVDYRLESSFSALCSLLQYFEVEYPYVNVIASGVFFLGLHALAKRQPDPLGILILAFPILIINVAMSGVRQSIAIGFLCFSYNAFTDQRLLRMLFFVGIAATFHTSAALFFVIAPFVKGEFSRQRFFFSALLALPVAYYLYNSGVFDVYTKRYVGTQTEAAGAPFRTALVALSGVVFLWFLYRKWKIQFIRDYKLVLLSSYMMLVTFPLSFYASVIGDRVAYYLIPIQLNMLTRLPFLLRGRNSMLIASAPYAIGALTLLVWVGTSSLFQRCYEPYRMWL